MRRKFFYGVFIWGCTGFDCERKGEHKHTEDANSSLKVALKLADNRSLALAA